MADSSDSSGQQQAGEGESHLCMACHKFEISYECMPCTHPTLCKPCAMKQATGGRCKHCGNIFTELRRKRVHSGEDSDEEADSRDAGHTATGEGGQEN